MNELYLIWSNEHRMWWRPAGFSYTPRLSDAGRFSRDEALAMCIHAMPGAERVLNELPVREADALEMVDAYERAYPGRAEAWQ